MLIPWFFAAVIALSAKPSGPPPVLHARAIQDEIVVDGQLNEPAWGGSEAVERGFILDPAATLVQNHDGGPASAGTRLIVLYNRQGVYLGIHCAEPDPANRRPPTTQPAELWDLDTLEIFFDPGRTRSRFCQIIVNTAGHAEIGFNGVYDPLEQAQWKVAVDDQGWTLEMLVPFETLRASATTGDAWGFNLFRTRKGNAERKTEQAAWSPTGGGFRRPDKFGMLVFGARHVLAGKPQELEPTDAQRSLLAEVRRTLEGKSRWTPADMGDEEAAVRAQRLVGLSRRINRLGEPVLVAAAKAITDDEVVFPWTVPTPQLLDPVILGAACPGEFEPASFMLFATRDLKNVSVEINSLVGQGGQQLDPATVAVHQVLCWYQNGWALVTAGGRTLVPELLVKDASLIEVDPVKRENKLNFDGLPIDSSVLKPFSLPAYEARQIWLTFRPPADASAGLYRTMALVKEDGRLIAAVPIRFTVLPFRLSPSVLSYSLYYRVRPSQSPDPVATMKRMAAEVRNQVEHGINMPSTYVGGESLRPDGPKMETLEELTRIYRELGLKDHPLILVTTAVGRQSSPEQLEHIRKMIRDLLAWARPRGYSDVYVQGIDEGGPETLRQERLAFQAVNEAGGKVFVACGPEFFDIVGDVLNMPVIGGSLLPELAGKVKAAGHRPFNYANPQAGVELPATYRRNYGIKLWKAGYDGGFDYEYQAWETNRAYNDFFEEHWRNHTMAYPTASGPPIDTRQWEGWREGVDDVRYLSTLLEALAAAKKAGRQPLAVAQTERWLESITGNEDLDRLRQEIISRIIVLRS